MIASARRVSAPAAALLGFLSVAAQSLLAREVLVIFNGNELSLGLVLALWLLLGGIGALAACRLPSDARASPAGFAVAAATAALCLPAGVLAARWAPAWLGLAAGAAPGVRTAALAAFVVLAGSAAAGGAWFTIVASLHGGDSAPGRAYAWEAAGGLAGGGVLSIALTGPADAFTLATLFAAATLGAAAWMVAAAFGSAARRIAGGLGALALVVALAEPLGHLAGRSQAARWPGFEVAAARDGLRGNLALLRSGGLTTLASNGAMGASFPDPETVEPSVHLPLLAAPSVRRILLVDGAWGGALAEALKHPVERVDYLESDDAVLPLVRPHLPPSLAAALDDPRVRLLRGDPRSWLAANPGRYDAVLLGVVEPGSALANRHATREFFTLVRAGLQRDAVASIALSGAANYLGPELRLRNASVARAFRAAFSGTQVLRDDPLTLLGGSGSWGGADPERIVARFLERDLDTETLSPEVIRALLDPERAAFARRELDAADVPENRDTAPVAYFHHVLHRESAADPAAAAWLAAPGKARRWWVFALPASIAALALLSRSDGPRGRRCASGVATAATGCAAMGLQFLLLFSWQSARGVLYPGLGILTGLHMAGLAAGGFLALRLLGRGAAPGTLVLRAEGALTMLPGVAGALLLAVLAAGAAARPLAADLLAGGAALAIGAAAGFEFPLLVPAAAGTKSAAQAGGGYYALELAGAAAGAILASLWLLPLLGLQAALAFFALLKGASWLLVLRSRVA